MTYSNFFRFFLFTRKRSETGGVLSVFGGARGSDSPGRRPCTQHFVVVASVTTCRRRPGVGWQGRATTVFDLPLLAAWECAKPGGAPVVHPRGRRRRGLPPPPSSLPPACPLGGGPLGAAPFPCRWYRTRRHGALVAAISGAFHELGHPSASAAAGRVQVFGLRPVAHRRVLLVWVGRVPVFGAHHPAGSLGCLLFLPMSFLNPFLALVLCIPSASPLVRCASTAESACGDDVCGSPGSTYVSLHATVAAPLDCLCMFTDWTTFPLLWTVRCRFTLPLFCSTARMVDTL